MGIIHNRRRMSGFSLMELMIVVAIMGILAAIAVPAYNDYLIKANRTAAKTFLLSIANKQEQYLLDQRSYASTVAALGLTAPPETSGKYTFAISNVANSPPTYTATATAVGSQASDGNLTIDQSGAKAPSNKW